MSRVDNEFSTLFNRYKSDDFDEASKPFFEQAAGNTSLAVCLTDPHQPDSPIVFANNAFCELTGYGLDEIIGKNCRFLQGPGTTDESLVNLRAALKNKYLSVTELVNYRKDGSAFLNALHMAPLFCRDGDLQLFYGSQMDTTETVTVDFARRKRALRLGGIGIWEFNPVTEHSYVDAAMLDLFGIPDTQKGTVFADLFHKVHPEDKTLVYKATQASMEDPNVSYQEDFRILLSDNSIRWIRSIGGIASASDGSGDRSFIGVSLDVTKEKEYEMALSQAHDTIKTIADELDHRMNNVFATMAALVSAGARGEVDAKTAATKTRERIMAMATSNKLTIGKGIDGEASLKDLIKGALAPYLGSATIEIEGEPLALEQQTLTSLGLIFHELATNSLKYGALNTVNGRLSVHWSVSEAGLCEIFWKEYNGEKTDLPVESTGFGTRLIDLSTNQIGGTLLREFQDTGLRIHLSFPINRQE